MIKNLVAWSLVVIVALVLLLFAFIAWYGRDQEIAVVPLTKSHQVRLVVRDDLDDFPDVFAVLEDDGREITKSELIVGISSRDRIDNLFSVRRAVNGAFEVVECSGPKEIVWLEANVESGTIDPKIGK